MTANNLVDLNLNQALKTSELLDGANGLGRGLYQLSLALGRVAKNRTNTVDVVRTFY